MDWSLIVEYDAEQNFLGKNLFFLWLTKIALH